MARKKKSEKTDWGQEIENMQARIDARRAGKDPDGAYVFHLSRKGANNVGKAMMSSGIDVNFEMKAVDVVAELTRLQNLCAALIECGKVLQDTKYEVFRSVLVASIYISEYAETFSSRQSKKALKILNELDEMSRSIGLPSLARARRGRF